MVDIDLEILSYVYINNGLIFKFKFYCINFYSIFYHDFTLCSIFVFNLSNEPKVTPFGKRLFIPNMSQKINSPQVPMTKVGICESPSPNTIALILVSISPCLDQTCLQFISKHICTNFNCNFKFIIASKIVKKGGWVWIWGCNKEISKQWLWHCNGFKFYGISLESCSRNNNVFGGL